MSCEIGIQAGGDRLILLPVEENDTASTLREKFLQMCKDDTFLNAQTRSSVPLFMLQHKVFGPVEVSSNFTSYNGQILSVKWMSKEQVDDKDSQEAEHHPTAFEKSVGDESSIYVDEECFLHPDPETEQNHISEDYSEDLERSKVTVEGGVCEVQLMKGEGFVDALVHQLHKFTLYSKAHSDAVKEIEEKINSNETVDHLENLVSAAQILNIKIVLYRQGESTMMINPFSNRVAKLVLQDENYHSFIDFTPFSREEESESEDDFSSVEEHFSPEEWEEYSHPERVRFKNMKARYLFMMSRNLSVKAPYFMQPDKRNLQTQAAPKPRKEFTETRRSSGRITSKRTSSEALTNPTEKRCKARASQQNSLVQNTAEQQEAVRQPLAEIQNEASTSQGTADQAQTPVKEGVRQPLVEIQNKASTSQRTADQAQTLGFRGIDKQIGYPAATCHFGPKALADIAKPALTRNMRHINADCKVHIRSLTNKDEYLSPTEWDNYCRTVVEAHPSLASEGSQNPWGSFKLSLQKSFSAERKSNKKKKARETEIVADNPSESVGKSDAEKAAEELMSGKVTDRRKIKTLLETSVDERKVQRNLYQPKELLEKFKHLKVSELMIYDYLTMQNFTLDNLEKIFHENCVLIGNHYGIESSNDMGRMLILMKAHEFFLSAPVAKDKAKAVMILRQESKDGLGAMDSSKIQAPFVVVLYKLDFVTGYKELRSATLNMGDDIISSLTNPAAAMIPVLLLAAYFTLNVEYPGPYQQFMRALEKLTTGQCERSKYGNSQKQFDKFISLVKTS